MRHGLRATGFVCISLPSREAKSFMKAANECATEGKTELLTSIGTAEAVP
jgi:hypothetical protein